MVLELYKQTEEKNPNSKVLSHALTTPDSGAFAEPPLIKALRKDRYDLFEIILDLNREKFLKYEEVLCLQDE